MHTSQIISNKNVQDFNIKIYWALWQIIKIQKLTRVIKRGYNKIIIIIEVSSLKLIRKIRYYEKGIAKTYH
jgi:hypothetical protein